jgi:hypothetical protein
MREQTLHYELCTSVENSPQTNPLIARIDTKAGHGSGRPTQKIVSILLLASYLIGRSFITDYQNGHICGVIYFGFLALSYSRMQH